MTSETRVILYTNHYSETILYLKKRPSGFEKSILIGFLSLLRGKSIAKRTKQKAHNPPPPPIIIPFTHRYRYHTMQESSKEIAWDNVPLGPPNAHINVEPAPQAIIYGDARVVQKEPRLLKRTLSRRLVVYHEHELKLTVACSNTGTIKTKGLPTWNNFVRSLARFKADFGHVRVPRTYYDYDEGLPLGDWVFTMLREYAAKKMNPTRRSQILTERQAAVLGTMGLQWDEQQPQDDEVHNLRQQNRPPVDSITWNDIYLYRRSENPTSFVKWAQDEVRYLEAREEETEDYDRPSYHLLENNFRKNLLKLTMANAPDFAKG